MRVRVGELGPDQRFRLLRRCCGRQSKGSGAACRQAQAAPELTIVHAAIQS
ncbi:MAG: hypothetical protein AVDCRST_MAG44-433 [uncultured Sphingomonas sp.]|uniref:Uncharacterized protein n=1 Tax=uncultured Sphingomonas sp. TaxID=158754 RepID=A0A6J4SIU3_9SPHN|nr:MAG: hypothetical protein AVDCRST_MAG44-433 [uncultured Sphingomonas sp.]